LKLVTPHPLPRDMGDTEGFNNKYYNIIKNIKLIYRTTSRTASSMADEK